MKTDSIINNFQGITVLVLGDTILDVYLDGTSTRLSPEAPVPVVDVQQERYFMGGAANVAVNLNALGARVTFCSVIGNDDGGRRVIQRLGSLGIRTDTIISAPERSTIVKERIMSASQLIARFDRGTENPLQHSTEELLIAQIRKAYPICDAMIIADYDKGILTSGIIESLAMLRGVTAPFLAIDSRRLGVFRKLHPSIVKPNYREAINLLALKPKVKDRVIQLKNKAQALQRATGSKLAVVTLDADGAIAFNTEKMVCHAYPPAVAHPHVIGAGDTFMSALTLALVCQANISEAITLSLAAASVSVSKENTACCSGLELRSFFVHQRKYVPSVDELREICNLYRRQGRKIVFTNGCFDILHSGHVNYLNEARKLGDVMIVGINNDDSIHRLKGAGRPINPIRDRIEVVGGLGAVDHITAFGRPDNDTPLELIEAIRPDIFVKGGDYAEKNLPEAPYVKKFGGQVHFIPFLPDHSTSGVIRRIQAAILQ